ncbi:MAG: hypothetical protein K6L60_05560 [Oceanobacter sp.]
MSNFMITPDHAATLTFVVQHLEVSSDYTAFGSAQAAWDDSEKHEDWVAEWNAHRDEAGSGPKHESAEAEFLASLTEYTPAEVLKEAADGQDWPVELGFVRR